MEGKRLLRDITLRSILSYSSPGVTLELGSLNVLIGPNGSGKSNLIEAVAILSAASNDLSAPIREGGGFAAWVWKGEDGATPQLPSVSAAVEYLGGAKQLEYDLVLGTSGYQTYVELERVEEGSSSNSSDYIYRYSPRTPPDNVSLETVASESGESRKRRRALDLTSIDPTQSILSQRKDPDRYPEITYLGKVFSQIYFFRSLNFGRRSPLRGPQPADLPSSFLMEDGRNLGMVLNDLLNRPATRRALMEHLRRFYESVEDVTTKVYAGVVETLFHERGLRDAIPASRLSDGTLRFLSLLTILCHPDPPPLICIEDPELGLHPDVLPLIGELLLDAAQRSQLIVTTHSDALVSSLGSVPECIVVCEKDDRGTQLRRLDPERLREWLENYSLGELWRMGETGGNL